MSKNITRVIFTVLVLLIVAGIGGVFVYNKYFSDQKNLDNFAIAYSQFRNSEYDAGITVYLPIIDFSKENCPEEMCGKPNFFSSLSGALDFKETPEYRVTNAKLAIDYYHNYNLKAFDQFDNDISKLNLNVSKLIVTANAIKDYENRSFAIKIAEQARDIENKYQKIREDEYDVFTAQVSVLNSLINNNGGITNLYEFKR